MVSVLAILSDQIEACLAGVSPRYSKATVRAYSAGLARFGRYAAEAGIESAAELTDEALLDFHSWLLNFQLAESTIGLAVRSVKLFLKWACVSGVSPSRLFLNSGKDFS